MPEFYMRFARKINKMPKFYTIFARKIVFARIWGQLPPPPSPTPMRRRGVAVNALVAINEVALRRTRILLGWVTVCGQISHLGMQPTT